MKTLYGDKTIRILISKPKVFEIIMVFDITVINMNQVPLRCDTVVKTVSYIVRAEDGEDGRFKTFSEEPPSIFEEVHRILVDQGIMKKTRKFSVRNLILSLGQNPWKEEFRFTEKFLESLK
jgi:hypothetical protein